MEYSQYTLTAKLINNTRNYFQLTREQLTSGLCEVSLLTKIISGDLHRRLDKLLIDSLLQRMGRTMKKFEYLLVPEEYALYEHRQSIRNQLVALQEGRKIDVCASFNEICIKIRAEIEDYKKLTLKANKLHRQFALLMESYLLAIEEQDVALQYETVRKALLLTMPKIESKSWDTLYYSEVELTLAIQMAHFNYLLDRKEEAVRRMEELYSLLERNYYQDGQQIAVFAPLLYRLAKHYKDTGNNERAYQISADGVKQLLAKNKFHYVKELLQIREEAMLAGQFSEGKLEEQWKKTVTYQYCQLLQGFFGEFYPSWNPEIYEPMYYEYGNLSLAEVVKQRREALGLTREEVVRYGAEEEREKGEEECCSVQTLARLENGKASTHWKYIKRILKKLELPPELCIYDVLVEEYEQMEERLTIAKLTERNKEQEAMWRLQYFKAEKKYIDCLTNRQELDFMELNIINKMNPVLPAKKIKQLLMLLELTLPKRCIESLEQYHVFPAEYNLIRGIGIELSKQGKQEESIALLGKLLQSYCVVVEEKSETTFELNGVLFAIREGFVHRAVGVLHTLEGKLADCGRFEEANQLLKLGIELSVRHNIAGILSYLLYDKAWNMEQEHAGSLDWEKYVQYIRTAYSIDKMCDEVVHFRGIEVHCQKYYPDKNILEDLEKLMV